MPHVPSFPCALLAAFALVAPLAACNDDPNRPSEQPNTLAGAVVLNGTGDVGLTVVPDTGTTTAHIAFTSPFDGTMMSLRADTVLTTSSALRGDLLFVTDLRTARVLKIQLPSASDPSGATFVPGGGAGSTFLVALRAGGSLARVHLTAGQSAAPQVEELAHAGACPYDALAAHGELWSLDANLDCAGGTFASLGGSRLVRFGADGVVRDTIELGAPLVGAVRVFAIGDTAFAFAPGDYFQTPAAVAKVNLATRQVMGRLIFPDGVFGAAFSLGADGRLYATASAGFSPYAPRVYTIDPRALAFAGPFVAGSQRRLLTMNGGGEPVCDAATADRAGRIHCIENGQVLATLVVFGADGSFLRSLPAGTRAYDVVAR